MGLGTTLGCARGCAKKAFCLPAAPHAVALCYWAMGSPFFFIVLGLGIVFSATPLFLAHHKYQ